MTSQSADPAIPGDPGLAEPETAVPAPAAEPAGTPAVTVPQQAASPVLPQHRIRRTRIGGAWTAVALFAVVLLLLLIFILENGQKVVVTYFGATGHLPLGVALLLAAVLGVLLVVIPGSARIIQLRVTARRHRRADNAVVTAPAAPASPAQP
jgi:uncharacterized integral membrane protein